MGVGFITLEETVHQETGILSYTYRFISDDYLYTTSRVSNNESDKHKVFSFHYDFYENNTPHEPHVTVCHPTMRYISRQITLEQFLSFVKDSFFYYEADKLRAKKDSIWFNRI